MTTLTRVTANLFGGEAPDNEIGVFGSAKAGQRINSSDVAEIQSLPAYKKGWGSAVVSSDNFPPMEEVTGVLKTISYQTCYLLQEGIPVYDAETEYSNTSIVKVITGNQVDFYLSQQDGNKGNSLSSTAWWRKADIIGSRDIGVPQITLNPNLTLADNCIWLEGQEVSQDEYPYLYTIYTTTYNLGDESAGNFRLPDFREKYFCGVDKGDETSMGYINAGLPNLQLTTTSNGAHNHTAGSLNATGSLSRIVINEEKSFSDSGVFASTNHYGSGDSSGWGFQGDGVCKSAKLNFELAGHWTSAGRTGDNGAHQHSVTSSNPLVGSANTVKVNGIKIRVYTRYE